MDRKADFEIRALELHSLYALDYAWIHKCLDYMTALGLNTLILHRNDIVEATVYPGALFGYEEKEGKGKPKNMIPWDKLAEFFKTNLK